jgi:hypothetical protein
MRRLKVLVSAIGTSIAVTSAAIAADLQPPAPAALAQPELAAGWTFRITPYAWLTGFNGKQTLRGRTASVNASFVDVVDQTIGTGGTLVALMADMEARNGRWGLLANVFWSKITLDRERGLSRELVPGLVTASLSAAAQLDYRMAVVEGGAAYEIGQMGPVAFDLLAGARYWHQTASIDLTATGRLEVADLLSISQTRDFARSGTVDWVDGFAGGRARIALAPGQNILLRGDIGAGGSKLTWQALAAYSYDFTTRNGITYSGVLGYRALYANYSQGEDLTRYKFDMLVHGPVVGLTIRF